MNSPMGLLRENSPVSADNSFALNSKIMIVAVVVLFGVVMFILGLHIYAKWFWRHGGQNGGSNGVGWRMRRRLEFAADWAGHQRTTQVGLERSVLDQLPTFTFNEEKASVNDGALECAVCLEEFAEGEKGRLLPKCNHSFHIDCIDMWFHSHSTCPLCRCSVASESPSTSQQSPAPSQSIDGVGVHHAPGDVVVRVSDGGVGVSSVSENDHFDNHQERPQASSAAIVVAVVDHGQEFFSPLDSAAGAGTGSALPSPLQHQLQQGLSPESPSSRRPSTGLSPKPSGIQYPANVLFWGNQTQMNAAGAGAVSGGPREENGRRRFSSRVQAPNSLVIEIPRAEPLDSSGGPAHQQNNTSIDDTHRASDTQGGGPRSPIGRLVTSSFRRLLSIRRGPTSPGPEGTCSSFDCEQQQQGSTISSTAGATTVQSSRPS